MRLKSKCYLFTLWVNLIFSPFIQRSELRDNTKILKILFFCFLLFLGDVFLFSKPSTFIFLFIGLYKNIEPITQLRTSCTHYPLKKSFFFKNEIIIFKIIYFKIYKNIKHACRLTRSRLARTRERFPT